LCSLICLHLCGIETHRGLIVHPHVDMNGYKILYEWLLVRGIPKYWQCNMSHCHLGSRNSPVDRPRIVKMYLSVQANTLFCIHSFSSLSHGRSKASYKTSCPHSAISSFLLQM
jgi:hypothetical protein